MSGPDNFDRLKSRVRLEGTLTTRTGLRVGAGKGGGDEDAVDLPILRDAEGFPYLPGASIKGVLRSTLESLLPGPDEEKKKLWACNPLDNGCGNHRSGERGKVDPNQHCTVCRLFGSHVVSSHIRISDARLKDRTGPSPIGRRDGVAIDRDLKSAHDKTKYDFQVVPPGVAFELEIFADNLDDGQLGLLLMSLDQLNEGFAALGGFTSRGLGRVGVAYTRLQNIDDPRQVLKTGALPAPITDPKAIEKTLDTWRAAVAKLAREGN